MTLHWMEYDRKGIPGCLFSPWLGHSSKIKGPWIKQIYLEGNGGSFPTQGFGKTIVIVSRHTFLGR